MSSTTSSSTTSATDTQQQVVYSSLKSSYSASGPLSQLQGKNTVNAQTTADWSTQSYQQSKFMKSFSTLKFEDLQAIDQPDGDTLYTYAETVDNQQYSLYYKASEILASTTLIEADDDAQIQAMAKKYNITADTATVTIDGKKYFVNMNIPLHFATGEQDNFFLDLGVLVLGNSTLSSAIAGIVAQLGSDAFNNVLKNVTTTLIKTMFQIVVGIVRVVFNSLVTFFYQLFTGSGFAEAINSARIVAGAAWDDTVAEMSMATLGYSFLGLVVLIVLYLIFEYVVHPSYQNVYFYNLTEYDVELNFPYKSEGDYDNLPSNIVLAGQDRTIGSNDLGTWYNGVAYQYQSGSDVEGLGYTLSINLKDPATQTVVKTFACMFDIPFEGDNSLLATTSAPSDYAQWYSSNEGANKVTQFSANDGKHEIIVTYDYLSGEQTDPESGKSLYLYNSLVIVREYMG
ncbi:MAG: hypothetical protein V4525_01340 [Pseudomonadota bacterium]